VYVARVASARLAESEQSFNAPATAGIENLCLAPALASLDPLALVFVLVCILCQRALTLPKTKLVRSLPGWYDSI
jgi:hypothetical protein